MVGVYVHIPFCVKKCLYCDFPSYGGVEKLIAPYVKAVCREIEAFPAGEQADTIYFGGGTPSLLSAQQVACILQAVQHRFSVAADAEITLEANPDSVSEDHIRALRGAGINRLSLGIQSFHDDVLKMLGRSHTVEQGLSAIEAIHRAGIRNISADVIIGLPGETLPMVVADLEKLVSLPITHASIYSLIVEAHTMMEKKIRLQQLSLPDEELRATMLESTWDFMQAHDFEHYEVSSYCRPGFASRHNSKYWQYEPYVGFGASAHSFYNNVRYANLSNLYAYMERAGQQDVVAESIVIGHDRAMEDYCFLALRMKQGIDYHDFRNRFRCSLEDSFGHVLSGLFQQGLLRETATGCSLTRLGLAYGNYVFSQFIRN